MKGWTGWDLRRIFTVSDKWLSINWKSFIFNIESHKSYKQQRLSVDVEFSDLRLWMCWKVCTTRQDTIVGGEQSYISVKIVAGSELLLLFNSHIYFIVTHILVTYMLLVKLSNKYFRVFCFNALWCGMLASWCRAVHNSLCSPQAVHLFSEDIQPMQSKNVFPFHITQSAIQWRDTIAIVNKNKSWKGLVSVSSQKSEMHQMNISDFLSFVPNSRYRGRHKSHSRKYHFVC